jgi:hypothetical protein
MPADKESAIFPAVTTLMTRSDLLFWFSLAWLLLLFVAAAWVLLK